LEINANKSQAGGCGTCGERQEKWTQVLVVKHEGNRPPGSPSCRRKDNTKIDRRELEWKTVN